jgi:monofunctional biosynthetic peptidoglycan transglycosylase
VETRDNSRAKDRAKTFVSAARRRWRVLCAAAAVIFVLWFVPAVPLLLMGRSVTVTQWDKKHGERRVKVGPGEPSWIRGKDLSRHVFHAFVVAEDARFYEHHGIDLGAIRESLEHNRKKGRYARGGSTITQQVVKMAFLTREKTLIRKSREALGAILLDAIADKDEILEWYVNLTEFGNGIYGVKAAAKHWFGTKPELLTIEQAIHLAIVIPSPNGWSKGLRRKDLTKFGEKRFATIARNMKLSGWITETQWITALSRGNFGRPLAGHLDLVAREQDTEKKCGAKKNCAGLSEPVELSAEEEWLWGEEDTDRSSMGAPSSEPSAVSSPEPPIEPASEPAQESAPEPDPETSPAEEPAASPNLEGAPVELPGPPEDDL